MLRRIKDEEFYKYIDMVYDLSINPKTASYPIFYDGLKTKEDFITYEASSLKDNNSSILLFIIDDKVLGYVNYYFLKEDNYLQVTRFVALNHIDILVKELLDYFKSEYSGYDFYVGFPDDNKETIKVFMDNGCILNEESYNHNIVDLNSINVKEKNNDIYRVTKDNYSLFEVLHKETEDEMYWTSKRIYEDLSNWLVLVKKSNNTSLATIYGYLDGNSLEVFGTNYINDFDSNIFMDLLNDLIIECKNMNMKSIIFFTEKDELPYMKELGFKLIGKYIGLKKRL